MRKIYQFPSFCSNSVHVLSLPVFSLVLLSGAITSPVFGETFPVPTARIVFVSLDSGQLQRTITDKVNHEVVLTIPTIYRQAYLFECNSSYPVEWSYFGEGAPSTNADVGRHFKDFYNVNSYTYQAVMFMHNLDELQSGRYVCKGSQPDQEKLQAYYDLFVPGNGTQMLISTAEKKVFVAESKLMTSIPCEVTDPSLTINLYKESWGAFQKLEMNDSILFRPRKGFIIKMHELPDPFGTYMCTTADNKRRRKVHLIPERFRKKYDDAIHFEGNKVPVQLSYDYEYNRMLCCSSGGGNALAPKLQWTACGSVLDCKIKSVCFEEDRCRDIHHKWQDPGPLPKGCAGWKLNDGPEGDFGILKCSSTPGVTQYQPFLLNRGNIFVDFGVAAPPSESILTMAKLSNDPIYLGSEVEYHCNSTRFYFAFGIRWAFKRGNDDIEFIGESSSYIVRDEYPVMSHMRRTRFRILHPDIKALICFVPIANSPTEWRTVSLPVVIRDSFQAPPISAARPASLDIHNNRIQHSSASQGYPVVEPYSTSRPTHLYHRHSTEVDPTPSVDIDEIMSLGGKHHLMGEEMPKVGPFSQHPHSSGKDNFSNRESSQHRFTQQSQSSGHHGFSHPAHGPSQQGYAQPPPSSSQQEFLTKGFPQSPQNTNQYVYPTSSPPQDSSHQIFPTAPHISNHVGFPQPTLASEQPNAQPEIITLDGVRNYQSEKYNFPSQAEIQEANIRHRHKFQLHHEGVVPYTTTTTQKSVFTPEYSTTTSNPSPSRYHKYSHPPHDPYYGHHYDFQDKHNEAENKNQDFDQHKEYTVSSRVGIRPQISSMDLGSAGHERPHSSDIHLRYPAYPTSNTTPKPFKYFNDKGFLSEKDSPESFGAPTPVHLPQYQRQPVIHYDSREKQYGLKDPLFPTTSKQWKTEIRKYTADVDHSAEESHVHSQLQSLPTTWDRSYSKSSDAKLLKSPVLEVEIPVAIEDSSSQYSSDDYYLSSLMARRKSTPNKSSRRKGGKKGGSDHRPNVETIDRRDYSPISDYDREREKFYYQRYADHKDSSNSGAQTHDHQTSPPVSNQPYLFGETNARRSRYHSQTGILG